MESRMIEIEIKLTYAEDMLDSLNRIVYQQQARIEQLQAMVSRLSKQIQDLTPPERRDAAEERPPHY